MLATLKVAGDSKGYFLKKRASREEERRKKKLIGSCGGVTDISTLPRCTQLRHVDLSGCDGITDVSPLAGCHHCESLEGMRLKPPENCLEKGLDAWFSCRKAVCLNPFS